MRIVMFFLYLFTLGLGLGNNCHSAVHQHSIGHASKQLVVEQDLTAFLDNPVIIGVMEDDFPDLVDDNTIEENENSGGKVFSGKDCLQNKWSANFANLFFVTCKFIPSLSLGGNTTPIYLTNRALRI
jgi:hypothetical protein